MFHISTAQASAPKSQASAESASLAFDRKIIILNSVADYHGEKASAAYLSGDIDLYCHHLAIADRLWARTA